jgi:hypothetical protein
VAIGWGGRAFWVLQDVLVNYISASTALDLYHFFASHPSEVNVISLSYGDAYKTKKGVIELDRGELFAGPIRPEGANKSSFQDMLRAPVCPSLPRLYNLLMKKMPSNRIVVP